MPGPNGALRRLRRLRRSENTEVVVNQDEQEAFRTRRNGIGSGRRPTSLVKIINQNVQKMLNHSAVVRDWKLNDEVLGMFKAQEIQKGQLLGVGGFCEVYACESFYPYERQDCTQSRQAARLRIAHSALRADGTTSRYAIKHLRPDLREVNPKQFCMAAADLVAEAQYLNALSHPNIISIHGWASGGTSAFLTGEYDSYFLIVDRLDETLDQRIEHWREQQRSFERLHGPGLEDPEIIYDKTKVAAQIASAVAYLHSMGIIHRDLKPNNIGFDVNGDVKLFDLGLARECPRGGSDEVFDMSGRIGVFRYAAPEVSKSECYNKKVDVYSWAMVFYSMLSTERPFDELTKAEHKELVCLQGMRPLVNSAWHFLIQDLLECCWSDSIPNRPPMDVVCTRLNDILLDLEVACLNSSSGASGFDVPSGEESLIAGEEEYTRRSLQREWQPYFVLKGHEICAATNNDLIDPANGGSFWIEQRLVTTYHMPMHEF